MKKIISLILAAALVLALTACSKQPANDGESSRSEASSGESVPEQPASVRGTLEDGVYRNTCGDFSIFFSESWEFDSDETLAADTGVAAELLAEGDAEKLFEQVSSVSELYAYRELDGSAVQIHLKQNLVPTADYLKMFLSQLTETWTESGFEVTDGEVRKFSVNGETVPGISMEASITAEGETVDTHYVALLREAGDYIYTIGIFTFNNVTAERVLSNVYFSADAEQQVDLRRGTVEDGVYTNASMGITVAPGDGWTFLSDDEMAALYGVSSELFTEDVAESMENSDGIYDMYCQNAEGSSINVNIDKGNLFSSLAISEKTYLEMSSAQLEDSVDPSSGIAMTRNEMGEIEINGATVPCIYVTLEYTDYGISVYEAVIAKKSGAYFAAITLGALSEGALSELAKTVTVE